MPVPRRRPTTERRSWLARLWAEVYLGALLVAVAAVGAAVAVLVVRTMFGISRWVVLGD